MERDKDMREYREDYDGYKGRGPARRNNDDKAKALSKKKLCDNAKKKFETAIIGILARIESYLGHLWGHLETNKTPEQNKLYQDWIDLRTEILNHGNNQKRLLLDELDRYTVKFDGYKVDFIIKREGE
jgi:hypothetical protein